MLPMYELMQKVNDNLNSNIQQILLNQVELIVNQEYENCLLEMNQTV